MRAPSVEKTGPDLTLGISIDALVDGASVAGHVGNDSVLLARHGNEFFESVLGVRDAFDTQCPLLPIAAGRIASLPGSRATEIR